MMYRISEVVANNARDGVVLKERQFASVHYGTSDLQSDHGEDKLPGLHLRSIEFAIS
jgi:hypothetical protein